MFYGVWNEPLPKSLSREEEEEEEEDGLKDRMTDIVWLGELSEFVLAIRKNKFHKNVRIGINHVGRLVEVRMPGNCGIDGIACLKGSWVVGKQVEE